MNTFWREKESDVKRRDKSTLETKVLEEKGIMSVDNAIDWVGIRTQEAMLPVPWRITKLWRDTRPTCLFEDWTGFEVTRRAMTLAWVAEDIRPAGLPYDMHYPKGEKEKPQLIYPFTPDSIAKECGVTYYRKGRRERMEYGVYNTHAKPRVTTCTVTGQKLKEGGTTNTTWTTTMICHYLNMIDGSWENPQYQGAVTCVAWCANQ